MQKIPESRVVASLMGSLPMGGSVPDAPIFALRENLFGPHDLSPPAAPSTRTDIDLDGQMAFLVSNVLTREQCARIVFATEAMGYSPAAPGIATPPGMRMNQSVHWIADRPFIEALGRRVLPHMPNTIDGRLLQDSLSQRINMYRYFPGDQFRFHIDGDWPGYGLSVDQTHMQEWTGMRSALSMLLYLNDEHDGLVGGATRLYSRAGAVVDVNPVAGDALFFRHGFNMDSVQHEGLPVQSGTKHLARINVMYEA
ncbi:Oxoglutarate/iron-dependent dioxygenase [Burkholderiales bacterium]